MADVTIASDQLASPWTIQNAAPDPTTGEVDEYNAAIALGAQLGIWYGDRIKAQSEEMLPDMEKLDAIRVAMDEMQSWSAAEWNSLFPADTVIGNTTYVADKTAAYTEIARRGSLLVSAGVDVTKEPYSLAFFTVPVQQSYQLLTYPIATISQPWPVDASGNETRLLLDTTGLSDGQIYSTSDGHFFVYDSRILSDRNMYSVQYHGPIVTDPFLGAGHITDERLNTLKKAVNDNAEQLTQVTQGKQAFLQELIASMSKYLSFATSLVQRYERNRLDIIGRF